MFLAILALYFLLALDPFAAVDNFLGVIRQVSVTGLFALGNAFVFLGGGVDLSVIAIGTTTAMVYAKLFYDSGFPSQAVFFIAVLLFAGLGLINGLSVTKARVSPFI